MMSDADIPSIVQFLRTQQPAMVSLLRQLVTAESPSDDPLSIEAVLRLLTVELESVGMNVRRVLGRWSAGMLYATPRNRTRRAPYQLLVGHCDTVWPVGTLRRRPVTVEEGILRGPGSFDMKGGLCQMLFALRALHELRLEPPATCVVTIDSDEEVGSRDATPLLRRLARDAGRAYVLEPAFGPSGKLKTARKAVGSFEVVVKGHAAHAGIDPEQGASAILEMSYQVQRLFALNDPERGITVNVGTIDGGLRSNVIAPEARATVDVRVPTRESAVEVEAAIRGLQPRDRRTAVRVDGGFAHPPMEPSPRNQALFRLARDLGTRLGLALEQTSVGGASDGNTISHYTATLDGLGAVGGGAHAESEYVEVGKMVERSALLVLLLLAPLERRNP